ARPSSTAPSNAGSLNSKSSAARCGSKKPWSMQPRKSDSRPSTNLNAYPDLEVLRPYVAASMYDNASFHQSATARQLIEGAGCAQRFLPPYSSDLNPIAHDWSPLKQRIRKHLPLYARDLHKTMDTVLTQQPAP